MGDSAVSSGTILSRRGQQEGCHCVTGMQIWACTLAMMIHLGCSSFFKQFLVKFTFRRDLPSAVVTLVRSSHALVWFFLVENWTHKTWPYPPHFAKVSLEYSLACWNSLQTQNFSWHFHTFCGKILVEIILNYLLSWRMMLNCTELADDAQLWYFVTVDIGSIGADTSIKIPQFRLIPIKVNYNITFL